MRNKSGAALPPPALKAFLISKKVSITFSFSLKNRNEELRGLRNVVKIIDENFTWICVAKRVGFAFNHPQNSTDQQVMTTVSDPQLVGGDKSE